MLRTAGFPVNKLVYCQPIKIQPLPHTARERISTASGYLMLFGLNLQFVLEGQRDSGRFMFRRCVGPLSDLWYLNRSRFHFEQFFAADVHCGHPNESQYHKPPLGDAPPAAQHWVRYPLQPCRRIADGPSSCWLGWSCTGVPGGLVDLLGSEPQLMGMRFVWGRDSEPCMLIFAWVILLSGGWGGMVFGFSNSSHNVCELMSL